ncbi:MAG: hypothetical protein IPK19_39925 [Chloroflexi bacterium]|nr:hypothetical protein [Chloroflexota bacterium]
MSGDTSGDIFVIGVANSYARDMLQHRLYRNVRRILAETYGAPVELRFEIFKPVLSAPAPVEIPGADAPLFRLLEQQRDSVDSSVPLHERLTRPSRTELPESELNPRFNFDRFVPGNENQMIYAARPSRSGRAGSTILFLFMAASGWGRPTSCKPSPTNARRAI